jgi:ABC-type dipeptide/oligopeptide/nickel transport system permease subunit
MDKKTLRVVLRNRTAMTGLVLASAFALCAALAPVLAPYAPLEQAMERSFIPPSAGHWLGTDEMGRDLMSRVLYGARVSMLIGAVSVGIALAGGTCLGLAAGYAGGRTDFLLMRVVDVMLSFPSVLLAVVVVAILGPKLQNAMIAVGIVGIPEYARLVRASVLAEKEKEHVQAAVALGAGHLRIVRVNILPNILSPLIVQSTLRFATAILDAAGLSFLGLGAQPPDIEWGLMLNSARPVMFQGWWIITFPGLAIMFTVLAFNLLGDGLRDALDPKMRGR